MSTKAVAWLFFFLSILNIPVFIFFYESNDAEIISVPMDYFAKLSLGNIGQAENACNQMNYATDREISFTCSSSFAKLSDLKYLGVVKKSKTTCKKVLLEESKDLPDLFETDCLYG